MKMKYQTGKAGGFVKQNEVGMVGKILEDIEAKKGIILPEYVLETARHSSSPLHKFFTWDDTEAAEAYRMIEARKLILSVQVQFTNESGDNINIRAFCNIKPDQTEEDDEVQSSGYVSVATVGRNEGYKAQVIQYAFNQLKLWEKKFGAYKEFFEVVTAIKRTRSKVIGVSSKTQ